MPGIKTAVKTRFAPSPTGFLHLGGARTALYAWLFARHMGGEFILRIEDTDIERSTQPAIDAILDGLKWLGLEWDQGPYYQTQRFERYRTVLQQMLAAGSAYKCYCSKERLNTLREQQRLQGQKPRYDRHCRDKPSASTDASAPFVIRFRNPQQGVVSFEDQVGGWISINNAELDDLILCRSDHTPTYNFCVVVDDWDMGITHVIRGEDHINNTPRQINLLRALGAPIPHYAHLSMILGADGQKLSKRHGAVSVLHYRDEGYLPQALLNYLLRLGWSHGDQEIFSVAEMQQHFSLAALHSAASSFNLDKLLWLNHHYINHLDPETVLQHLQWQLQQQSIDICEGPPLDVLLSLLGPRCKTLTALAQASRCFFQESIIVDEQAAERYLTPSAHAALHMTYSELAALGEWTPAAIHQVIQQIALRLAIPIGQVGMPLRVAVTGSHQSPSIDATLHAIGKSRTLMRIKQTVDKLAQQTAHPG